MCIKVFACNIWLQPFVMYYTRLVLFINFTNAYFILLEFEGIIVLIT